LGQRRVHGYRRVAQATGALVVATRLAEGGPQRQCGVLRGVVRGDVQSTVGPHGRVVPAVSGGQVAHVVGETDAGGGVRRAGAGEVDLDHDLGFLRGALHTCGTARGYVLR